MTLSISGAALIYYVCCYPSLAGYQRVILNIILVLNINFHRLQHHQTTFSVP